MQIRHPKTTPAESSLLNLFSPALIFRLIKNTSTLRHTPPPRRATTTRKIHIINPIRITMNPIIINIIVWILIRPEFILPIDPIEANVGFVSCTVGEFANVAFADCSCFWIEAFVFNVEKVLFEHVFEDFVVGF
jgi:hypothetical protein